MIFLLVEHLLLAERVPITTVSSILGHANVSITLAIYAHDLPEDLSQVSDAMSRISKAIG